MLRNLLRPELLIYISFFIFTSVFVGLNLWDGEASDYRLLQYYVQVTGDKIIELALLLFVLFSIRAALFCMSAAVKGLDPAAVFSLQNIPRIKSACSVFLENLLGIGVPFLLAFYSLSLAIGQLNIFNKLRLQDELLVRWDFFLTHTFPPLALGSLHYPAWFVKAVEVSFMHLVPAFILFAAYLFLARQRLFREAAAAFFAGASMMFLGWIMFPVLSPHDRFIDNVYHLPAPPAIQEYVDNYHPQEEIKSSLERLRMNKEGLSVLPTSTFPSAHVVWAVLFVYYAYRTHRWLAFFAVPFAILSAIGTVLFAQHYFADIPAGILVAFVSILLVRWLIKKGESLKEKSPDPSGALDPHTN